MEYYALIIAAVILFGFNFALNDVYRKVRGSTVKASLEATLFGGVIGIIVLIILNGFDLVFTPFLMIMSFISALNGFAFTFCGFKALNSINLSLYSLFSMLGGMMLPFVQGILFYGEKITLAKILCFLFICAALVLTVEKGEKRNGMIYYVGIFVLNGMSGVITKIYNTAPFVRGNAATYSVMTAVWGIIVSGILLLTVFRRYNEEKTVSLKSICVSAANGTLNRVANYMLVISLVHVESTVQYPMVTGGVMIVSTLICFFGKNKPKKKEIVSVALAFIGLLILFLLPIILKNI